MLSTHNEVATASEPWLLLPYVYALKKRGVYAEYGHNLLAIAFEDFVKEMPGGMNDYLAELREHILKLYNRAAKGQKEYFLDKSPRYHLIVEDIMRIFPEGKFIFLWRNPLALIASLMATWADHKWNLYRYKVDLYDGLSNLVAAYQKHRGQVCVLRYEDLLTFPEKELKRVCAYLDLTYDQKLYVEFSKTKLRGRTGDPTGTNEYKTLSLAPLEKWKYMLNNPFRRAWCQRYLEWIGKERLALMGYDLDSLVAELGAVPLNLRYFGSDLLRVSYGIAFSTLEPRIMLHKLQILPAWHRVYAHE